MPRLRRLSGSEVIAILTRFGFEVIRIRGSHHRLRRVSGTGSQFLSVPVHGKKPLSITTLKSVYRQARQYIAEAELKSYFYADE